MSSQISIPEASRENYRQSSLTQVSRLRKGFNDKIAAFHAVNTYVDRNGRTFIRLMLTFILCAASRYVYIAMSPQLLPYDDHLSLYLLLCLGILSFITMRYGLVEVTLLLRSGAFTVCAALWMRSSCALVFYTGQNFLFVDSSLAFIDRMIGFDWVAYFRYFDERPLLWSVMYDAYASIYLQLPLICFILAITRETARLYALLLAQMISLQVVATIAVFTPALGASLYFEAARAGFRHSVFISPDDVASAIFWLRQTSSAPPPDLPPLITFPSFHASCAFLYAWSLWTTPSLRWFAFALNATMLLATPVLGSHYLIDVIVGVAIAGGTSYVSQKIVAGFMAATACGSTQVLRTPALTRSLRARPRS